MKEFIVKTNFGHTYRWSADLIAKDYAATAIQWQGEDDIENPKTEEELYNEIVNDENFLSQWFSDYIAHEISYSLGEAELIEVNQKEYDGFVRWAIHTFGKEA